MTEKLLSAAMNGREAQVDELLKLPKVDINGKDMLHGYTPLQWAIIRGHNGTVEALLNHGADINSVSATKGWTALHFAGIQVN